MQILAMNGPSFRSKLAIDVGGSTREGSCKVNYATNDLRPLYKKKTTVNDMGVERFKGNDDFLNKIADKAVAAQKESSSSISKMNLPESENTIKSMVFFMPSYTFNNKVLYTANLRDSENKPLRDIDFEKLRKILPQKGVKVDPKADIKVLQDAMGSGLAITEKLYKKDMLKAGDYYTIAITGGGCGIANVRALPEKKALVESSGSSYLTDGQGVVKISRLGASAPSVIRNYGKAFGLDEETAEEIASCGIGYVATEPAFEPPATPQGQKLKNILMKTERYEDASDEYGTGFIKVKDKYLEKFEHARYNAINKYAHALARLAVIKENEGSNGMIVTGPLASALDKSCRNNYQTTLSDWIQDKIEESYNTYELGKMQSKYKFKVICSKDFALNDNTAGTELAHTGKFIGNDRFNWLEVDLSKIDKSKKDFD